MGKKLGQLTYCVYLFEVRDVLVTEGKCVKRYIWMITMFHLLTSVVVICVDALCDN